MATETTNYKLKKPSQEEFYDVEVFNNNADIIDAAIAAAAESGGASEETVAKLDEILTALKNISVSYKKVSSGEMTQAGSISFNFKEIDTITNDAETDVTITFRTALSETEGTFVLKPGESINDVHLSGTGFTVSGTEVKVRYLLLG